MSTVTKAKNEELKANVDGREITLDNTENLLEHTNGILDGHEFKNRCNNIVKDVEAIVNNVLITRSQAKIVEILLLLKEILNPKKSDEQPDITDMSELGSEASAAERRNKSGEGLKILTPNQICSRLPITLAQLKAGNNSDKLDMKLGNYCILWADHKNLQKNFIKVWPTLYKNGNNLQEHWE